MTESALLVWVNGVTPEGGRWIDRKWMPSVLHNMDATFDVWLYDGDPLERGAFAPQLFSPEAFDGE